MLYKKIFEGIHSYQLKKSFGRFSVWAGNLEQFYLLSGNSLCLVVHRRVPATSIEKSVFEILKSFTCGGARALQMRMSLITAPLQFLQPSQNDRFFMRKLYLLSIYFIVIIGSICYYYFVGREHRNTQN